MQTKVLYSRIGQLPPTTLASAAKYYRPDSKFEGYSGRKPKTFFVDPYMRISNSEPSCTVTVARNQFVDTNRPIFLTTLVLIPFATTLLFLTVLGDSGWSVCPRPCH